jgi:hypothetical protein
MHLIDIIPNSTLVIIATYKGEESVEKAKLFTEINEYVASHFEKVRVIFNSTEDAPMNEVKKFIDVYTTTFPGAKCIYRLCNDGHMFGTMDLDEMCLWYAKEDGSKYLWKSTEDVIMDSNILGMKVPDGTEFAYLPGFSYEDLYLSLGTAEFISRYEDYPFTPQSNFFILDVTKVESLYGNDVQEKRSIYLSLLKEKPSLKPWEINFPDCVKFSCESHLGRSTKGLKKACLLSEESFTSLAKHVRDHKEGNPAHPNIYLKEPGICHFHNYKNPVYYI